MAENRTRAASPAPGAATRRKVTDVDDDGVAAAARVIERGQPAIQCQPLPDTRDDALPILRQEVSKDNKARGARLMGERSYIEDAVFAAALDNTQSSAIRGVPIDRRPAAQQVFHNYLNASQVAQRRPILASTGFRGTGKTTLLALNMVWFLEAKKNGVAIQVTFNSDQGFIGTLHEITDARSFQVAVALRILHRLTAYVHGSYAANFYPLDIPDVSKLLELLRGEIAPIQFAIAVVRHVLDLSEDTPVLLAVDELALSVKGLTLKAQAVLRSLCQSLTEQLIYLSVSAYECVYFSTLVTDSGRTVFLQPLPPILPLDISNVNLLPPILRPFCNESERVALTQHHTAACDKLSNAFLLASGHPRRLEWLLERLWNIGSIADLEEADIVSQFRQSEVEMPQELANLQDVHFEHIAQRTACVFRFPSVSSYDENGRPIAITSSDTAILDCCKRGHCQFLPLPPLLPEQLPRFSNGARGHPAYLDGHAYIPSHLLHSLSGSEADFASRTDVLTKFQHSLCQLGSSLDAYAKEEGKSTGKPFENVIAASLLHYARCNDRFFPASLCRLSNLDDQPMALRGGLGVKFLTDVNIFPCARVNFQPVFESVSTLISRLDDGAPGLVCVPTHQFNLGCDVVGLFCRADGPGYVLLAIQAKNWFTPPRKCTFPAEFDWNMQCWTADQYCGLRETTNAVVNMTIADLQRHSVTPIFIMCTINREHSLDENITESTIGAGVMDLVGMRTWLPSAAYGAELAQSLRQLFRPFDSNPDPDESAAT